MSQKFISLEIIAQIEQAAQNGCLYSQTQLEILEKEKIAESYGHPIDNWSGLTY